SISAWFSLWTVLVERTPRTAHGGSLLTLMAVVAVAGVAGGPAAPGIRRSGLSWSALERSTASTVASLLLLALIGVPTVYTRLGPAAANVIHSLRSSHLSRLDTV